MYVVAICYRRSLFNEHHVPELCASAFVSVDASARKNETALCARISFRTWLHKPSNFDVYGASDGARDFGCRLARISRFRNCWFIDFGDGYRPENFG